MVFRRCWDIQGGVVMPPVADELRGYGPYAVARLQDMDRNGRGT
jgi:hypothetical protein